MAFDFFSYKSKIYALIQTNQCNADICLAVSDDAINFRMYNKPLITNKSISKIGIYKSTGVVIGDTFYLYYTAQDRNNQPLNHLYLFVINFENLLSKII